MSPSVFGSSLSSVGQPAPLTPPRPRHRRLLSVLAATAVAPALFGCTPLTGAVQGATAADAAQGAPVAVDSAPAPETTPAPVTTPPPPAAEPAGTPAPEATTPAPAPAPEPEPEPAPEPAPAPLADPEPTTPAPAPTQAPAPQAPVAAGTQARSSAPGNPLAGDRFFGPNPGAAQAAAQLEGHDPGAAALLADMASVPTATWVGAWDRDVTGVVRQRVAEARAAGAVPVFVAYAVPGLDCGGYSAGGTSSPQAYTSWVQGVAAGIGNAEAVVVVEPDALAQLCGDANQRLGLIRSAVQTLEANPGTHTYVDAGHSGWVPAGTMAERLRAAGVDEADGFALNVSNFQTTPANVTYGNAISAALGGAHFVVDTSRNGNGANGGEWCNPGGRALGERPTAATGESLVDAFLWIKRPGESDGQCNGGPAAGTFWTEYALGLARN
jgi:endoglucanase